jgi:hypothetical protein
MDEKPHLVYFDGNMKDFHQGMFDDIVKSLKLIKEIDRLGWNKFLGIRWAIGPKMLVVLGEKRLVFPFFGLIKFWLRLSYYLRSR